MKTLNKFKLIVFASLSILINIKASAQCTLNLISSVDTVTCGGCVTLSAFGSMNGNIAFQEDFNSGSPVGWQFTQTVTIADNTCGIPSPDGSDFMWMGDQSVNPRDMTTVGFDLTLGGTICFEMRYSIQADPSPCEGPDEPGEGVYLQYSIDNGTTWVTIDYWDPNGGNDPSLTAWNQYCVSIPSAAMTTNTMIRWHQEDVSGAVYDHWGIDNVQITLNDPNIQITWLHDGYSYPTGSGGGFNPTDVCLTSPGTYTAQITNGIDTCTESITVYTKNPIVEVLVEPDTLICPGECVQIVGTSNVIVSPGGIKKFENNQAETVNGSGIGNIGASVNVNVQGLNMTGVLAGSITEVCINNFNYFSFGVPTSVTVADFEYKLVAPAGCADIILIPQGSLQPSTQFGPGMQNVCFTVGGATNLGTVAEPYTGVYAPNQSFNNAVGCDPNGVWTIEITAPGGFTVGSGVFNGWSITFDDIEINYAADFSWSPTAGLSDTSLLSPTVCPTGPVTYILSASDSNNCVVATDSVTIKMNPACCVFDISAVVTPPSCIANDGSIDLSVTNGSGNFSYDWGGGITSQDMSSLGPGVYTVLITDITQGCSRDTTFTLLPQNAPVIDSIVVTNSTCNNSDGSLTIFASGGTGTLTYSLNNGTPQTNSLFGGLNASTYDVTVFDAAGCSVSQQATVNDISTLAITNITSTDPTCGNNDGTITITITGGVAPYSYSIDNGNTTQTSGNFSGLSDGTYTVTVKDSNNCTVSQIITLVRNMGVVAGFLPSPSSGASPLEVVFTNNSTGAVSYEWIFGDGNTSTLTNPTNIFMDEGEYNVMLIATDVNGCKDTAVVTIVVDGEFVILIPNVFTPNGDNQNDVFKIQTAFIDKLNVKIFNRWGLKLYEITSPSDFWDGGDAPDGTYFIILEAESNAGDVINKTGTITLIR